MWLAFDVQVISFIQQICSRCQTSNRKTSWRHQTILPQSNPKCRSANLYCAIISTQRTTRRNKVTLHPWRSHQPGSKLAYGDWAGSRLALVRSFATAQYVSTSSYRKCVGFKCLRADPQTDYTRKGWTLVYFFVQKRHAWSTDMSRVLILPQPYKFLTILPPSLLKSACQTRLGITQHPLIKNISKLIRI